MKIKLPEKRFFTTAELAQRWEVLEADVIHLVETGELRLVIKFAALSGKRGIGFVRLGQRSKPMFVLGSDELRSAIDDKNSFRVMVAAGSEALGEDSVAWIGVYTTGNSVKDFCSAIEAATETSLPQDEFVILLEDVLLFESKYAAGDSICRSVSDNTMLSTVAALLASWPNGKQPTGKDLERAAASVGVTISDDSIRKALKAARELAPSLNCA